MSPGTAHAFQCDCLRMITSHNKEGMYAVTLEFQYAIKHFYALKSSACLLHQHACLV